MTPRQRETHGLILRTLGEIMAKRWEDWCAVTAGEVPLRVPVPVAGHIAREFEGILRGALRTSFELGSQPLGDDEVAPQRGPPTPGDDPVIAASDTDEDPIASNHRAEIDAICQRVGLPLGGPVHKAWKRLQGRQHGRAHWRSFRYSLPVGAMAEMIKEFELVMHGVLTALEEGYDAFFKQIDRLCASGNQHEAVEEYATKIPLSPILQQRFYSRAPITVAWITALRDKKLFSDRSPLELPEASNDGATYVPWHQRFYLIRAAESDDARVRQRVSEVVGDLALTDDIAVLDTCMTSVTLLPASEAAPFAEIIVKWLNGRVTWPVSSKAATFVKKMSSANLSTPAFEVAQALFAFTIDEDGTTRLRFESSMYAHHAKLAGPQLTGIDAARTFELFLPLLVKALEYRALLDLDRDHDHSVSGYGSMLGPGPTGYEEPDALAHVVTEAAGAAAVSPDQARHMIGRLHGLRIRLADQIALDLATCNVTQVPDAADALLLDERLMDGHWCRRQYASLARARLPGGPPALTDSVLRLAKALPERYRGNWLEYRRSTGQPEPTEKEIADFHAETVFDTLFQFRDVLPADVRTALEKSKSHYSVEPHIAAPELASGTVAPSKNFVTFPPGSTGALMEETKKNPEGFLNEKRLVETPIENLWIVFDSLKDAQNAGKPIAWEPILNWIETTLPAHDRWPEPNKGKPLRAALVSALLLIAANLERVDANKSPLPYMRLSNLVFRLWQFPLDPPATEFPWVEIDPAGASFRTVAGLSLLIGFRLAFLEDPVLSSDAGFVPGEFSAAVFQRLNALILDPNPTADLCRGQIGMWFSNLMGIAPAWTAEQIPALFGNWVQNEIRPAWYGYAHRAVAKAEAVFALAPHYRAAIEHVGDDEPPDWGDLRPSYQVGFRLIREYMLGHIGFEDTGLLASFLRRASDDLRGRLVWIVWRWVGGAEADQEIIDRSVRFAEARLAVADEANTIDDLKKEFDRFSTWLEAPQLDVEWLLGFIGRIGDLGLVGVGIFAIFRWLEKICVAYPDAALDTAYRVALHYDADSQAIYGSTNHLCSVLTAAITMGSDETVKRAMKLATALEVRGIPGMYDHVKRLLDGL